MEASNVLCTYLIHSRLVLVYMYSIARYGASALAVEGIVC